MIRRLLVAAAVLGATIYWANCSYNPPRAATIFWNRFFEGCFAGATTDPAGGQVTVILDAPDGTEDAETMTGCLQLQIGPAVLATLVGDVEDDARADALLTVTPTNGRPPFNLRAVRQPADQTNAVTLDLSDEGGAPFSSANGLARCAMTCADLGLPMAFMPGAP